MGRNRPVGRAVISAALLGAAASLAAPAPNAAAPTTPASVQQNTKQERATPPVAQTATQVVQEIGGGFHAIGHRREPVWIGYKRDSGVRPRPC